MVLPACADSSCWQLIYAAAEAVQVACLSILFSFGCVLQLVPQSAALCVIALSHACLADNDCKPEAVPASGASWAAAWT